jgi:uncharacterized protein
MSRSSLRVGVAELRRRPGTQRDLDVIALLPGLALTTSRVPDGAELAVSGVLESLSDGVTATGEVRASFTGECRRCLGEVTGELVAPFQEVFEPHPVEGETYLLDGDEVDLEQMVRDAVLLALPLAPLCRADCPGPVPDLVPVVVPDEADDELGLHPIDERWSALDALRFDS